ncbi:MAG: efflux RND transporter permease subunit [Pseudomonadales bacterium]
MWIADLCIRRPVLAIMMVGALMGLGFISMGRISIDLFPNVEVPIVTVETVLDGASPGTMETEVTDTLEEEFISIAGVKSLRSVSSDGFSQIIIEFEMAEDPNFKAQEVRDKISQIMPELPDTVKQPVVTMLDSESEPIIAVIVSGPRPAGELTAFAKDVIKERLQRISGVGGVKLVGGREREVRIWLKAPQMRGFGITTNDVVSAVQREHADIPGGRLDSRGGQSELIIKTMGEVVSLREMGEIVITRNGKATVRLKDVAEIDDGLEDERSYSELNEKAGVSLEIRKQSGTNTVDIARAIKDELTKLATEIPPDIEVTALRDSSRFIESSVRDVSYDILLGVALVVIVTLCFLLSIRATLIVATAIPTALIATFFAFYLLDFSINMISLIAISLCVGLLVDDAIVVLESIHREVEAGRDLREAASVGTRNVATAVIAATLAVMAVFLPITFTSGLIGVFFYQYGMTVSIAVALSLFISITLTPMLSSRLLKKSEGHKGLFALLDRAYTQLETTYVKSVRFTLRTRWLALLLASAAVAIGVYFAGKVPLAFTSSTDRSEFLATVELPLGTGIAASRLVAARVNNAMQDQEHINLVFTVIGSGAQAKANEISFYFGLTPKQQRNIHQKVVMDRAREVLNEAVPEVKHISIAEVPWLSGSGLFGADIALALSGPDLEQLRKYADGITSQMEASGIFKDTKSSYEPGKPEVQVTIKRGRAADLGISVRDIAASVGATMGGIDIASYEEFGNRYDIRLRYAESYRDQISKFDLIQLRSADGTLIDFNNVAEVNVTSGPAQIDRYNRARKIELSGNAPPGYASGDLMDKMDEIISGLDLAPGYETAYLGSSEQITEIAEAMLFAVMLSLVSLYMILASQFNSYTQPIVIMLTAPLSFAGAFSLLALTNSALSVTTQIALVALMGLVMKNGILLVDYANQAVARGLSASEAMLEAAHLRLRPILMTAFSTIFGMIPIALATSDGAELRTGMGVIVIGGLISSTFLTLFVVPVVYTLLADAKIFSRRLIAVER